MSPSTPPEEVVEFDIETFKTNDKKSNIQSKDSHQKVDPLNSFTGSAKTAQEVQLFSPRKFDNHKTVKFETSQVFYLLRYTSGSDKSKSSILNENVEMSVICADDTAQLD